MSNKSIKFIEKNYLLLSGILILGLAVGLFAADWFSLVGGMAVPVQENRQIQRGNCLADECLLVDDLEYPVSELPTEVKAALDMAINDEYKALATYEAVIAKWGAVRPFSMIKGAEEQHIASLKAIYDKYGLEVPVNTWPQKVSLPATLSEACQVGVEAEIANAALYRDQLLPQVTGYEDITLVFETLMNASQQKHLPAFQRCQ